MWHTIREYLLFLGIFGVTGAKELRWKYSSVISNPENWVGGKLSTGCTGVHFARINSATAYIDQLTTAEISFPMDGHIVLEGHIEFRDTKKCINLKPFKLHDYYDPASWFQNTTNSATPDLSKAPCDHDTVVFPVSFDKLGIRLPNHETIKVNKVRPIEPHYTLNPIFSFTPDCTDPYGCVCHDQFVPCPMTEDQPKPRCLLPIIPEEFCHEMCGAYLTYQPGHGPTVTDVEKKLREYDVDTFVNKVKNYLGSEVVQVVFSEKEYTGKSLIEAEKFKKFLEGSQAKHVLYIQAGQPVVEEDHVVGIVFGTLATVLVFFGVLLYVNENPKFGTMMNRLNRPRGSIFTPFFARFDNTDENLIIDAQSQSGSILDIAKSFDNPMYGQSSETHHENPLYEAAKDIED